MKETTAGGGKYYVPTAYISLCVCFADCLGPQMGFLNLSENENGSSKRRSAESSKKLRQSEMFRPSFQCLGFIKVGGNRHPHIHPDAVFCEVSDPIDLTLIYRIHRTLNSCPHDSKSICRGENATYTYTYLNWMN